MHSKKRKSNKSSSLSKKRNNNYSVNVVNKKMATETDFGGYQLDLLFGIL